MSAERRAPWARGPIRAMPIVATVLSLAAPWWSVGCATRTGPPTITLGTPCATCGMEVRDLRFACARVGSGGPRVYDSIECLLGDHLPTAKARVYLTDYDRSTLHEADSLWVVKGSFPSPMGGGFAAFLSRGSAQEVATEAAGRVDRLDGFAASRAETRP